MENTSKQIAEIIKCMDCGKDVFVYSATLFNDDIEDGETEKYLCPDCYKVRMGE